MPVAIATKRDGDSHKLFHFFNCSVPYINYDKYEKKSIGSINIFWAEVAFKHHRVGGWSCIQASFGEILILHENNRYAPRHAFIHFLYIGKKINHVAHQPTYLSQERVKYKMAYIFIDGWP